MKLATAFDPTLTDPLEQLRLTIRTFLLHQAEHPELGGLMNIEGRQNTDRLAYICTTYIEPGLKPVQRLLEHLEATGRIHPIPLRTFHFLVTHRAGAPITLVPLAEMFDPADPLDPDTAHTHADQCANHIVRALEVTHEPPPAPTKAHQTRHRPILPELSRAHGLNRPPTPSMHDTGRRVGNTLQRLAPNI
jgi:TetR/AcrR family transcriptional regulator